MNTPVILPFCADEDIAVISSADFPLLVPRSQVRAAATDGALSAGLWTFISASCNFQTLGVVPGNVLQIWMPTGISSRADSSPTLFGISSVATNTLTLHRIGELDGIGMPPSMSAATTLRFLVATYGPQIDNASFRLYRRYGIDVAIPGRAPASLYDVRETNEACCLDVLRAQCIAQARQAGEGGNDDFWAKAVAYKEQIDDCLARLVLNWQNISGWGLPLEPQSSIFSTRLSR